jgi:hypothetical protein
MVTELQSCEVGIRTAQLQEPPAEHYSCGIICRRLRLVHTVDDMDTVVLVAVSRLSCTAHISAVLTASRFLQDFDLQR